MLQAHVHEHTFQYLVGVGWEEGVGGRQDKYLVEIGLNNVKLVLTVIADLTHTHTHTHTHIHTEFSVGWAGQVSSLRPPSSSWRATQLFR